MDRLWVDPTIAKEAVSQRALSWKPPSVTAGSVPLGQVNLTRPAPPGRYGQLLDRPAPRGVGEERMKNRLRVLRAEREWTQSDLAERLGVSRQTIHAIEREKFDASLRLAFRISRLFGMPIERIFDPRSGDGR